MTGSGEAAAAVGMKRIRVTQTKSLIGCPRDQRRTVKSLGLKRIGHSVEHEDSPSIRGMIFKVRHLVTSEDKA